MYTSYAAVPDEMAALREIVMARKEPRKLMVQPHLKRRADGAPGAEYTDFAPSPEGMVESFVARFPAEDLELYALYEAEKPFHTTAV